MVANIPSLPNEIKLLIFAELLDACSVRSLALVSRDYYHCMRSDERNIVCRALKRDVLALREAIAVSTARKVSPHEWSAQEVETFLLVDKHTDAFLSECNLSKAFELTRLNILVVGIAKRMSSKFLRCAADRLLKAAAVEPGPSRTEKIHMERSLYLIELFGIFFHRLDVPQQQGRYARLEKGGDQAFWDLFMQQFKDQVLLAYRFLWLELTPGRCLVPRYIDRMQLLTAHF
jgi:hypothetical protein